MIKWSTIENVQTFQKKIDVKGRATPKRTDARDYLSRNDGIKPPRTIAREFQHSTLKSACAVVGTSDCLRFISPCTKTKAIFTSQLRPFKSEVLVTQNPLGGVRLIFYQGQE